MGKIKSFTLLELLLTLAIIGIMFAALVSLKIPFARRQGMETSAVNLLGDLRLTQQLARAQSDEYKYYGLRFYENIGVDDDGDAIPDRVGYKILRYNPPGGVEPLEHTPPVDLDDFAVVKSSEAADNAEFAEDTFFAQGVELDDASEFQVSPSPPKLHSIVFTPEGSATSDGANLLDENNDEITLNMDGNTQSLSITPLTGHVRIQ